MNKNNLVLGTDFEKNLIEIGTYVRAGILEKYEHVYGRCIEATENIHKLINQHLLKDLEENNYTLVEVEGWADFEVNWEGCSDASFDPHTWLEIRQGDKLVYFVDCTYDQFARYYYEEVPEVIVSDELFYGAKYDKPFNMFDIE